MLTSAVVPVQICIGFIGIFVVLVLRKVRAHIFVTDKAQFACPKNILNAQAARQCIKLSIVPFACCHVLVSL